MTYTFEIAQTEAEAQEAHDFALALNGAHFCPADAKPSVLINSLAHFDSPRGLTWIVAREQGRLVGVLAEAVGVVPGVYNLNVVGAIDPDAYTDELAVGLIGSVTDLLSYDGSLGDGWPWMAILAANSPMLPTILEAYGGEHGEITQKPYRSEETGLIQLEGRLRPDAG